jgi:hypothetical protein
MSTSRNDEGDTGRVDGRDSDSRQPVGAEHRFVALAVVTAVLLAAVVALAIALLVGPSHPRKTTRAVHSAAATSVH